MKNILKLLMILCLVGCKSEEDEPKACCGIGPLYHYITIKETSPEYEFFFTEGKDTAKYDKNSPEYLLYLRKKLDTTHIQLFDEDNKQMAIFASVGGRIELNFDRNIDHKTVLIARDLPKEEFDGKKETTFLKNRAKTYKIETLSRKTSYMDSTYFELLEVYIDGVRQADSITKKQVINL